MFEDGEGSEKNNWAGKVSNDISVLADFNNQTVQNKPMSN